MINKKYPSSIWAELVAEAEVVSRELIKLLDKRQLWRAHNATLVGNGVEGPTALVHHWLHENYLDSIIIGLRRALDDDKQATSLVKLLQKIERRQSEFTLVRFQTLYTDTLAAFGKELAGADFGRFSRDGVEIDGELIKADILRLKRDHARLLEAANTRSRTSTLGIGFRPLRPLTLSEILTALWVTWWR
ncbi:MAG: hypothetical protein IPK67_17295 [Planctomycetes bacterium]|nr:hypothetical protein [Planctomycetota bacterium]